MIIYYALFLAWLFIYCFTRQYTIAEYRESDYEMPNTKRRRTAAICCGVLLFIIMAFRSPSVGTDTYSYMNEYNNYVYSLSFDSIKSIFQNEVGYQALKAIFRFAGASWQVFLICVSAFVAYAYSKFIYRYAANIFLGFYLFGTIGMFAMALTGFRQTIAVACVLMAFMKWRDKKYALYVLYTIIGCSIHYTAIICFPLAAVTLLRYAGRKQLLCISLIPVIVRFSSSFLYPLIMRFSLRKYSFNGYFSDLNLKISGIVELVAFAILLACLLCLLLNREVKDRDVQFFTLLSVYVSCIELSHVIYMASRLGYYFIFFMTTMLANAIYRIDNKTIRYIGMIFMLLLPLLQFMISIPGSSYGIDQYIFFWN